MLYIKNFCLFFDTKLARCFFLYKSSIFTYLPALYKIKQGSSVCFQTLLPCLINIPNFRGIKYFQTILNNKRLFSDITLIRTAPFYNIKWSVEYLKF